MTTASLPVELHLEILKRLSPSPQVLARVSAVCREWRRVLNDPGFLHEMYRARHGAPVTLGFFHNFDHLPRSKCSNNFDHVPRSRFVHVNAADPVRIAFDSIDRMNYLQFMDCRHGRVLLHEEYPGRFVVWQPMTGDHHFFEDNGVFGIRGKQTSAALICECAADGGGDERKLGERTPCHARHFHVAVVSNHLRTGCVEATVFSSLTGRWSPLAKLPETYQIRPEPCVVVGKTLYQPLFDYLVLAFDMDHWTLTTFERPKCGNFRLLKVDGGVLVLAGVHGFTLCLLVRCEDNWVMKKTVDLSEILPSLSTVTDPRFAFMPPVKIIGVVDEGAELFLWTMIGIFMLSVESMELKKVHKTTHNMNTIYPYGAFYLLPTARTQRLQISSRVT